MALEFHNDITAGTVLVRDAIQSQGYVAGASGWSINQSGSAEFNNVAIRGSLTTGPVGSDHITIPDGQAEVDFVLGVNGATARAITKQLGTGAGSVANINLESSPYTGFGGVTNRAALSLRGQAGGGFNQLGFVKDSDDVTFIGPKVTLAEGSGGFVQLAVYDTTGATVSGGVLTVDDVGFTLQDNNATGYLQSNGTGIEGHGSFPADSLINPVFTPAANWTVNSFSLYVWGPFVRINLSVTRNAAALAAGIVNNAVGTLSFGTSDTAFPAATEILTAASGAGTLNAGVGFIATGGAVTLEWTAAAMVVGAAIRLSGVYVKA